MHTQNTFWILKKKKEENPIQIRLTSRIKSNRRSIWLPSIGIEIEISITINSKWNNLLVTSVIAVHISNNHSPDKYAKQGNSKSDINKSYENYNSGLFKHRIFSTYKLLQYKSLNKIKMNHDNDTQTHCSTHSNRKTKKQRPVQIKLWK